VQSSMPMALRQSLQLTVMIAVSTSFHYALRMSKNRLLGGKLSNFFILVSSCGPTVELITSTHTLQQKLHQLLQVSLLTEVRILNN
jgi:hypothetical protein